MPHSNYSQSEVDGLISDLQQKIYKLDDGLTALQKQIEEVKTIMYSMHNQVDAVTPLTVHEGNLYLDKDGMQVSHLDIKGKVIFKANNCVLNHCLVRGDGESEQLVEAFRPGTSGNHVHNSTLKPDKPIPALCGIKGWASVTNTTIEGCEDGVQLWGDDLIIKNCLIQDLRWYESTRYHKDGSHSDGIQLFGGSNIQIENVVIVNNPKSNSAIMVSQGQKAIDGLSITDCTFSNESEERVPAMINLSDAGKGTPMQDVVISNNKHEGEYGYKVLSSKQTQPNVMEIDNSWQ